MTIARKQSPYRVGRLFLTERDGFWHIYGRHDSDRIRRSTGETELYRAKLKLDAFVRERESGWRVANDDPDVTWESIARITWRRHRWSAGQRGIPFEITQRQVFELMKAAGFRCVVSGIAFSKQRLAGERDPWAASIDRIENRHGYLPDNIRIVCCAANLAMNSWGYSALLRLSLAVVNASRRVEPEMNSDTAEPTRAPTIAQAIVVTL